MAGDLGTQGPRVHENGVHENGAIEREAQGVLDFWFGLPPEKHFAKDADLDAQIAARFGGLRDAVFADAAAGWRDHPDTLLAAIILLDQFSRNMYRDTPRAFEADDLAVSLTLAAIGNGWEERYPAERRVFLYMPLMHAEDISIQNLSVDKFLALGIEMNIEFAMEHSGVIARYGRFPSRNAALGRASTPEELTYLSQPDAGW